MAKYATTSTTASTTNRRAAALSAIRLALPPAGAARPSRFIQAKTWGIFLKGVGLEVLWPQALAMFAWGLGILTLATLRSSKRLA